MSGVPGLDALLGGGLPARSSTVVLGPPGSGKTILGLHSLAEGAARGDNLVHFGFHEPPAAIFTKSRGLGLDTTAGRDRLEVVWQPRAECVVDVLGARLFEAIRRRSARRLFIDGLEGFEATSDISGVACLDLN